MNPGDGLRTDFNLYEFGAGRLPATAGLLRMEIDYMEIRLPDEHTGSHNLDGTVEAATTSLAQEPVGVRRRSAGYNVWRANFGESSGSGGSAAVPEPVRGVDVASRSIHRLRPPATHCMAVEFDGRGSIEHRNQGRTHAAFP